MISGDLSTLRDANTKALMNLLFIQEEPLSLTELNEHTGLSRPTLQGCLDYLEQQGLVQQTLNASTAKGGRRARAYIFDYDYGIVAGIVLDRYKVTVSLANLKGQVLNHSEAILNPGDNRQDVALTMLNQCLSNLEKSAAALQCVCVATVGETTHLGRKLHRKAFPEMQQDDFFASFARNFPCPVLYCNDADLAAIAEYRELEKNQFLAPHQEKFIHNFAPSQPCPQVMVGINIDSAYGAGIIIDGRLFTGTHLAAGEMGHDPATGWPKSFTLFEKRRAELGLSLDGIYAAASRGDKKAQDVILDFIDSGLPGISFLICAFDPQIVSISGSVALLGDVVKDFISTQLAKTLPSLPQIYISKLQGRSVQKGSVRYAINYLQDYSFGVFDEQS